VELPEIDAAIAGVQVEIREQQAVVARVRTSHIHWALLTLMWHGLSQLKWLEGQRRLIQLGRLAKRKAD
jgi:hypothetical protein